MKTGSEISAVHPRLSFGPEDIEALQEKRDADLFAAAAWARVLDMAQAGMELPPVEWQPRWEYDKGESGQMSLGGALGNAAHLAGHLAFAFLSWKGRPCRRFRFCASVGGPAFRCIVTRGRILSL